MNTILELSPGLFLSFGCYFCLVFLIGYLSYSRSISASDFVLGNRSLGSWATALAAHASDMSSWLFMAYPAMIFLGGLPAGWIAIGLLLFMYLNWKLIAPKIRIATEKVGALTFFSYIEKRFDDQSGKLRIATTSASFVFYTIYIAAGLLSIGLLSENLLGIPYALAILFAALLALPYILMGGYKTLAWIDLFQGLFLMAVIAFVPLYILLHRAESLPLSLSLFSEEYTPMKALSLLFGWGLGYFGQPAILTKFMGIKKTDAMKKSMWIGMSWMTISLAAATLVGLVGSAFFATSCSNPEMLFIEMVKSSFSPFIAGFILCAIFAATLNVMSAQLLVLSTSASEDLYKRHLRPQASSKELLAASRLFILFILALALLIASTKCSSIYSLVLYAWSGLGAAFGPLLLFALYSKQVNRKGAWAGILTGSITSALLPSFSRITLDPLLIAFAVSSASIWLVSYLTRKSHGEVYYGN